VRRRAAALLAALLLLSCSVLGAQDRFPRPEFDSGYAMPQVQTPAPRADWWIAADVAALAVALAASAFLVLKRRSRAGVVLLSILSLAYFGFLRKGCVCAVGSIQNVAQALFDPGYALPVSVALFFILPVAATLFFGRTYCAGVCPFGAMQDLIHVRTVTVPAWLDRSLSALPFLLLGFVVLCAATGTGYFICRFDPFVGIFRLSTSLPMAVFSAAVLGASFFIGRPYCRWLCPYGAVLSAASLLSRRHATIAPGECVDCRLCAHSCPVDAILPPVERPRDAHAGRLQAGLRRTIMSAPAFLAAGALIGWLGSALIMPLHPDVALLRQVSAETEFSRGSTPESAAFLASGVPLSDLASRSARASASIRLGATLYGVYSAIVFFLLSVSFHRVRRAEGYRIHTGRCVSCARCFELCPVERKGSAP
jgi:NosR/NirI family transcriptional regulator, nitrous oxide reductase regulator